ncbi:anti-sigma-D factor RsdA [Sphaerisporangium fuscum]|nr:anti-sigma-D factor RsdA [Sphaerisporangium fuscum]
MLRTDALIDALARREPVDGHDDDVAVRLLGALAADVDQRLSSVSITPST